VFERDFSTFLSDLESVAEADSMKINVKVSTMDSIEENIIVISIWKLFMLMRNGRMNYRVH
jgi:hypothetical protein